MQGLGCPQVPHSSATEMKMGQSTRTGLRKAWVPPPVSPSHDFSSSISHFSRGFGFFLGAVLLLFRPKLAGHVGRSSGAGAALPLAALSYSAGGGGVPYHRWETLLHLPATLPSRHRQEWPDPLWWKLGRRPMGADGRPLQAATQVSRLGAGAFYDRGWELGLQRLVAPGGHAQVLALPASKWWHPARDGPDVGHLQEFLASRCDHLQGLVARS